MSPAPTPATSEPVSRVNTPRKSDAGDTPSKKKKKGKKLVDDDVDIAPKAFD